MEQIIQATLNDYVIPSVVTALGSLLVYLLGIAAQWLKSHVRDSQFRGAVDKLTHLASQAVHEQEQILVKSLKVSGDWNLRSQASAKAKAREVVERHLGGPGMAALQAGLGHRKGEDGQKVVQGMLDSAIEAAVAQMSAGGLTIESTAEGPALLTDEFVREFKRVVEMDAARGTPEKTTDDPTSPLEG